jgi:hypothetical protein
MNRIIGDTRVGRAGPARDHADARLAGQLAIRLGHEGGAALLAADDQLDPLARVVQRVDHRQITLTRNAERGVYTMRAERVHQDPAAARQRRVLIHGLPPVLAVGLYGEAAGDLIRAKGRL